MGDLYQHSVITQLLFENKGLFQSWTPYADIPNFTYHFGLHSNAVIFQWLSKENAAQAIMIFGQIINIFAVIVLYPLAVYISPKKNKWAGVIAVFIGGFLLNMPNFYTNWGRYTQLIGQVILIPLVLFIWKILDEKKLAWNNIILAAIMLTGLALSHYRILIIFVLFVPIILFISKTIGFKMKIFKIGSIGIFSFGLFLPWFINSFAGSMIDQLFGIFHASQIQLSNNGIDLIVKTSLEFIGFFNYVPKWLWVIIVLSIVYFIIKANLNHLKIFVWWLFVFIVGFPQLFLLPGKDILSGFAVLISLYIPIGIIVGYFFC